ncbi:methylated-DNA--[protein]-cysteine S-methyltransferase [Marinobacter confluentis]|nr:methylated-DNA--[protein]-cysteine S-methyltransferase [Marinobacter confluentis]
MARDQMIASDESRLDARSAIDRKEKGANLVIEYATAPCFLGWVIVAVNDKGICAIEFGDDPSSLPAQVQQRFSKAQLEAGGPELSTIIDSVVSLIDAPDSDTQLPLDIQGTAFQQRVWNALRTIRPGQTASYTQVACKIGSPESVRAVAQACAANKLGFVVPCHRVVRSDGSLSGYRWGVERKRRLLEREGLASKLNV